MSGVMEPYDLTVSKLMDALAGADPNALVCMEEDGILWGFNVEDISATAFAHRPVVKLRRRAKEDTP